ncbi:MAG: DUF58 domain-containing protein [Alicyclobacillaceae bacterium]|nr:DUF58 domain-containing protein [Alicyclobacillaceae bacterium]
MTARRLLFFVLQMALLVGLYIFGRVNGGFFSWFLFYFTLCLSVYEWGTAWTGLSGLAVDKQVSAERLTAGQSLRIMLDFERSGWWPLSWLRLAEDVPERIGLQAVPQSVMLIPLFSKKFQYAYQLDRLPRGVFHIGSTSLETGDWLGIVHSHGQHESSYHITVVPATVEVRGWLLKSTEEGGLRQSVRQRSEESSSVVGVRDYVEGDRLSRVHWPATARRGMLQAKEFERQISADVAFLVDASATSYAPFTPEEFERSMVMTASLMRHAQQLRRRFTLMVYRGHVHMLPPGSQEALFVRAMDILAELTPSESMPFADTVARLAADAPRGSSLVLVSPRFDAAMLQSVWALRRQHPMEWFAPVAPAGLTTESRVVVQRLQEMGVRVHLIGDVAQLGTLRKEGMNVVQRA